MTTARSTLWLGLALGALTLYPYPICALVAGPGDADSWSVAGHLCILSADLALLIAALVLALQARLIANTTGDRMAACAVLLAVQDVPLTMLGIADPDHVGFAYRFNPGHLVEAALILLVHLPFGVSRRALRSPLALGFGLGLATLLPQLALLMSGNPRFLDLSRGPDAVAIAAVAALAVVVAFVLLRSSLPGWAARRMGITVVALLVGRLWATAIDASTPPLLTVVTIVGFSTLVVTTVVGLLRDALAANDAQIAVLVHRTADAEATVQHDREIAHEVRAAVAGIVAGAQLLAGGRVPPGPRHAALQQMIEAEAARLERRLSSAPAPAAQAIDVDELIEPLVVAHEARGHAVDWSPTGHRVLGSPDALAEVLSILLTNAHRHARGAGTTVLVSRARESVEIRIADQGPGLEPLALEHLFEWGARGSTSGGEGIGLQRALRLMQEQGGSLCHATPPGRSGATFVLTLPAVDTAADPPECLDRRRASRLDRLVPAGAEADSLRIERGAAS